MNRKRLITSLLFAGGLWLLSGSMTIPVNKGVQLTYTAKTLHNGSYTKIVADVYYKPLDGYMLMHHTYPIEMIYLTNAKGEARIYDPKNNSVMVKNQVAFSSENSYLYFFLSNQASDLGFKAQGFMLSATRFEDDLMVTDWLPPQGMGNVLSKVEMAHEQYLPIYLGFYSPKQALVKKIYYTDYKQYGLVSLPSEITQFDYVTKTDSIITKTSFSNINFNASLKSPYFNFTIPDDAQLVD